MAGEARKFRIMLPRIYRFVKQIFRGIGLEYVLGVSVDKSRNLLNLFLVFLPNTTRNFYGNKMLFMIS